MFFDDGNSNQFDFLTNTHTHMRTRTDSSSTLAVPLAASSASLVEAVGSEIASSRLRWLVLFLYGLQSICNAVLWVHYASTDDMHRKMEWRQC
jgi:hypothetical protein